MKIYWSKGLYYNGRLVKFSWTLKQLLGALEGFGRTTRNIFIKRFELSHHHKCRQLLYPRPTPTRHKILNNYVSYIINSSSNFEELLRYAEIRLYLTKTFRGRARALGKPSRGQRTWSNAWTAHSHNKLLSTFITQVNKSRKAKIRRRKIDYKRVARKLKKKIFRFKPVVIKKEFNSWF